jgi:hypothetical protein
VEELFFDMSHNQGIWNENKLQIILQRQKKREPCHNEMGPLYHRLTSKIQ